MHEDLIKRIRQKLSLPKNHSTLVKKTQIIKYISQLNLQNKAMLYHLNKSEQDIQINVNKLHSKQKQLQQIQNLLLTYELQYQKKNKENQILKNKIKFIQQYVQKCKLEIKILSPQGKLQMIEKNQKIVHDLSQINQLSISNDGELAIVELMKGLKNFMKSTNEKEDLMLNSKIQMENSSPTFFQLSNQFLKEEHKNKQNSYSSSSDIDEVDETKYINVSQEGSRYNERSQYTQEDSQQSEDSEINKNGSLKNKQIQNKEKKLDMMNIFAGFSQTSKK